MSYGVKHAKTIMWITSESTILDFVVAWVSSDYLQHCSPSGCCQTVRRSRRKGGRQLQRKQEK